jgi:galactonate dehydratase
VQPLWVEDPLPIDSTASQADLARTASVPVAHGERLHSHWEVRELLERGGPQWIRVDVGLAGGVTGARRAAAVADAFASRVVFHNWLGPVLTATTAHLTAALPNAPLLEWWPPVEDGLAAPFLTAAHRREGGWLRLADVPGHGAEADLDRPTPVDVAGPGRLTQPLRRDGSVARSP